MYENIKKAVMDYEAESVAKFNAAIENKTAGELLAVWGWRDMMTPKTFEAIQASEPDEKPAPELLEKIKAKHARQEAKRTAERLERVAEVEAAAAVPCVSVNVEYIKSRTWGYNAAATVRAWHDVTEGYASGCGYDKESAAIASAMNKNPEIMRILYDHAEAGEAFPYSVSVFAGLPVFVGGCGVECFEKVFAACGYDWREAGRGNHFAVYNIERK
jgi:hypothetical protein